MMRIHLDPDPQHWPHLRIRIRGPAFILNQEMEILDSPEIKKKIKCKRGKRHFLKLYGMMSFKMD
jgi:hypothetical protein